MANAGTVRSLTLEGTCTVEYDISVQKGLYVHGSCSFLSVAVSTCWSCRLPIRKHGTLFQELTASVLGMWLEFQGKCWNTPTSYHPPHPQQPSTHLGPAWGGVQLGARVLLVRESMDCCDLASVMSPSEHAAQGGRGLAVVRFVQKGGFAHAA